MSDFEIRIERRKLYKSPILYYNLQNIRDKYDHPDIIDKLQSSYLFIDKYLTNQFHDNEELKAYIIARLLEDNIKFRKKRETILYIDKTELNMIIASTLFFGLFFILLLFLGWSWSGK